MTGGRHFGARAPATLVGRRSDGDVVPAPGRGRIGVPPCGRALAWSNLAPSQPGQSATAAVPVKGASRPGGQTAREEHRNEK
jgi:hypothetical protein